jgi:DNA-binding MarR family transcriptional regulator
MRFEDVIKSRFRNEFHKLRLNLYYTNNVLNSEIPMLLKPYNITPQQYNVLRILRGQHPHPVSIKTIKERLLDKNSDVSRIIDKLLLKGLIERKECPSDRRQKDIIITKKGLDLLNAIDEKESLLDDSIRKNLSEEEAKTLNELLDKLRG